ncbi:phage major tail protein, TP901-1 family [Rummeliibacillus stabekisii]|uniref:phage major tail protein, TP901-1 family n=1 Tax=Rummeliibacillus stabekisii TaxID=241244 RepID=UPI00371C2320
MGVSKKIAGADVLLKVTQEDGTTIAVGGQTSATLNRGADTIDTTDKTTDGFKTSMAGLISWSVDCDGFVVLGDEGYELIEDAFLSRSPIEVVLRVGASEESNGVTYTGSGYIVDLPLEFGQEDAVTYSLSVEGGSKLERQKGSVVAE